MVGWCLCPRGFSFFFGLLDCLCPGCGRGWSISPLPGVWAWLSLVGCLLALSVGSGLLLMVYCVVVVAFPSFWGG